MLVVAFVRLLRTMGSSREVWGLHPQLGVQPLHPVLSLVTLAIPMVLVVLLGVMLVGCPRRANLTVQI